MSWFGLICIAIGFHLPTSSCPQRNNNVEHSCLTHLKLSLVCSSACVSRACHHCAGVFSERKRTWSRTPIWLNIVSYLSCMTCFWDFYSWRVCNFLPFFVLACIRTQLTITERKCEGLQNGKRSLTNTYSSTLCHHIMWRRSTTWM